MTGFGRSAGTIGKYSWNWETKSVNGKGLDIKCRLPHGMEDLELKAKHLASQKFSRGNVNLNLSSLSIPKLILLHFSSEKIHPHPVSKLPLI